jgi:ATP-binding cassette, subfamily B, multidrug efflux pump
MEKSPVSTKRAIRFLLSHLKRHSLSLLLGFFVLVAVDSLQLVIPRIIQSILDRLGAQDYSTSFTVKYSLLIAALALAMVVFRFLWRLLIVKPSRKIEERMRLDMFSHLEQLSAPYFNRTKTGDLMALFVNDLSAIRMATSMALIGMFDAVFMSAMSLAFMVATSPLLTLLTALPLPLIIVLFLRTGRMIERRYTKVQESFSAISTHTQESFSGIRVIKGFAQEENELERFRTGCDSYVNLNLSLTKVWGLIFPTITFLASLSFSLLLLFGGRLVLADRLTIGEFVSFTFYINLLVWPMIATGWVWNMVQRGIASTKRIMELLDATPDVKTAATAPVAAAPLKGAVEFRHCSFRYAPDGPAVLQDISLTVPAGSSVGVIGKPGAGKTTLASLLFHLYPVERGMLLIDGRDINDIPLVTLRRAISYVPQDSFLFSDTIAGNIAFAADEDSPPSRREIEAAARAAGVHHDIMQFTDGYDTRIGERGITLSGGQKQRVAIARALMVPHAPLLILDDALSAVDAATEGAILANLRSSIARTTSFIIAHRISTVKHCDVIIVLDRGRIAEIGAHEQLAANGGFYSTLCRLQRLKGETA